VTCISAPVLVYGTKSVTVEYLLKFILDDQLPMIRRVGCDYSWLFGVSGKC
jgi:hypothetical protein